jgi:hypothetical protein
MPGPRRRAKLGATDVLDYRLAVPGAAIFLRSRKATALAGPENLVNRATGGAFPPALGQAPLHQQPSRGHQG